MKLFSLEGRTALVTGGSSGIGTGIAQGLAEAGARVAIVGRDEKKNAAALAQLNSASGQHVAIAADLSDANEVDGLIQRACDALGGSLDILVNNAGTTHRATADEFPLNEWDRIVALNLKVPFVLSQHFAKHRIANGGGGVILMTGSLMCEASRPGTSAYTASKGGIRQLVKALAVDWALHGIRVNGISPGYIDTPLTKPLKDDEQFDSWVKKRTPLGRWGTPDDFRGVSVFLASDAGSFVTGQLVYIDGGWLSTF